MLSKLTAGVLVAFSLLVTIFPASGCSPSQAPESDGKDRVDLAGLVTEEQLYRAFPAWRENASSYSAKPEVVDQLRKIETKLEVVVFFGTWCGDSRSEVPKFLQVYDTVANRNFSLRMYGVDRSKPDALSKTIGIERIPTIIFFSGGKELGRIVESPRTTIEEDFLAIVSGIEPAPIYHGDPTDEDSDTEFA